MDKEYIEREVALNELKEELTVETPMYTDEQNRCIDLGLRIAIKDIAKLPTADVISVTRCKNCKHWKSGEDMVDCHTNLDENIGECHCSQWENDYFYYLTKDTDFCSYGEEK